MQNNANNKEKDSKNTKRLNELSFHIMFHEDVIAFHQHMKEQYEKQKSELLSDQIGLDYKEEHKNKHKAGMSALR